MKTRARAGVIASRKTDHDIQIFVHQRKGSAGTTVPFLWFCFNGVFSGMLGHADPGFTLRTYPFAHTSNPMQVKAAETIGRVMGKSL